MKSTDRARLTAALREHVAAIAGDLRTQMRAPGGARRLAVQLHKDEAVGDDFDVWTDLLSRRAAVLWVLKSVYVRVLEDRGLLAPGRLLDTEAQQLFEKLAPNLGDTAFLRWVYKDLASSNGGLPELFSVQPAELVLPSDARSRALIAFWRHRDADSGDSWSFKEERFEGELMGDLYQELDPVVKDRFALCQTPDFVREFILDRTLTPAIETFGADKVRLLDPACGSGHFLIDGLKRLVVATAALHKGWSRGKVLESALGRVVGMDLNDYACALARARLVMTAAELAGVNTLAEAARFHPHVYWADGLEQVERDEVKPSLQFGLFEAAAVEEKPRAALTRGDVRAELRKVFAEKFHAVVANPPYITEKDPARKEYHREKVGKVQRYVSAYREYSLGSPFTERCFQLAEKNGYVGIITSNNFMKREFGKPLIEKVLSSLDLTLVVDTSQAYIPFHGTPTVLIFGRNRRSVGELIRAVMGKRGEVGTPPDPAKGQVWSSIVSGWNQPGFENGFISVADLRRETLSKHPWSLGGGGAAELRERIEEIGGDTLGTIAEVGTGAVTREDDVFLIGRANAIRMGIPTTQIRPLVEGDVVRDWALADPVHAIWPYDPETLEAIDASHSVSVSRALWLWRARLARRIAYGKSQLEHGLKWFEYSMFFAERFRSPFTITFAFVATHNHFVLDRGGKVFNRSAPVIKLPAGATEGDHLALLGLLNSSAACFWMKQVFHNKGGGTDAGKWQSDPAKIAYEFTSTGMQNFPLPDRDKYRGFLIGYSSRIDKLAKERASLLGGALPDVDILVSLPVAEIRSRIANAEAREGLLLSRQIALHEELDWLAYRMYGLSEDLLVLDPDMVESGPGIQIGARPFEIIQARQGREVGVDSQRLLDALPPDTDPRVVNIWESRISIIERSAALSLIENENYKRRWLLTPKHLAGKVESFAIRLEARLTELLAEVVEIAARQRNTPFEAARIMADLQDDARFSMLAELFTKRKDYSHEQLVLSFLIDDMVPNHPSHRYSKSGLVKRRAWESTWEDQRREDAGESIIPAVPPTYAQPDFISRRIFELRGKLDVPKERFIAFTEVPGRTGAETLYGWAGWTPLQRLKALLTIDEELEDAGIPLADRTGVLDSAWRLLPDVAREDAPAAARLKAELQALVGPSGPSPESLEDWRKRFPPPKPPKKKTERARKAPRAEEENDT